MLVPLALCVTPAKADPAAVDPTAAAIPQPSTTPVATAIGLLLEKAQFWSDKGHPDVALNFYNRVISLQPDNTEALAGASKVSLDLGHDAQARDYLEKLRKISPNDEFVTNFDSAKRRPPEDGAILADARRLALLGRKEEAVAKYRSMFKDNQVPYDLAAEYYPLFISSVPEESVEADDALTALKDLAAKNPKDLSLQLAAGWALILTDGGRTEGIERLSALSKIPSLTQRATSLWRQAVLWEGPSLDSQEHLENYLKDHPIDTELEAKRAEYLASLPDIGVRSRWRAGDAIAAKDWKGAEYQLNVALNFNKEDPEALAMLALVHKLNGKGQDWQGLYKQASKLAPEKEPEFSQMLGLDAERAINEKYREVDRLTDAGKYDQAESLLRSLLGGQRNVGSYLQLATIQTKAGHPDKAIESLQVVLASDPNNPDANEALGELYINQHRYSEAKPLLARAEQGYQKKPDERGLKVVHAAQADLMRVEALNIADLGARESALRSALAVDPSSWWIRLEIARTLWSEGRKPEAQQIVDAAQNAAAAPNALSTPSGSAALQVAFIWAVDRGDDARALSLAQMVPASSRSGGMKDMLALMAFKASVAEAAKGRDPGGLLLAMAAQPDPTGERGVEIAHAFLKMQDIGDLREALSRGLESTPKQTGRQRLAYASVLMEANQNVAAHSILVDINVNTLNPDQRATMGKMYDNIVVGEADKLVQQRRFVDARRLVQAQLAQHPESTTLKVALARVDVASGQNNGALDTLLTLVASNPDDSAARFGAIEAATSAGRLSLADDLAQDGVRLHPNDPYMLIQAANVARARGLNRRALDYLERAKSLRAANVIPSTAATVSE